MRNGHIISEMSKFARNGQKSPLRGILGNSKTNPFRIGKMIQKWAQGPLLKAFSLFIKPKERVFLINIRDSLGGLTYNRRIFELILQLGSYLNPKARGLRISDYRQGPLKPQGMVSLTAPPSSVVIHQSI